MVKASRETRSKFLKVKCPDCENEQLVFEKATSVVECTVCGRVLAEPTGGKAVIKADIVATFE
ncbi:MAG: 30S ribosomal protein S27e [Methanocorpusculum sp.]|jgi:small subunit ribosomal protein S27e|uniref:30S ribosomal protein S27e n=1 Tax=bioreactor metagenome TaxID=1076179 RepID=A0A644UU76_9ZZZZ|nr:30S ribosomal protein S27e [Methanocorpusculum sp.]MDO9522098.1 30S ribosomal protein S27e [Methanocorpusculum sp.]MEA5037921.1 30S ribosomal protein S27e [Methanocorpusculum sp.]